MRIAMTRRCSALVSFCHASLFGLLVVSLACGSTLKEPLVPTEEIVEQDGDPPKFELTDEFVNNANVSIVSQSGEGFSAGCFCSDGNRGYTLRDDKLDNNGQTISWYGCCRSSLFEGDPNSGQRCDGKEAVIKTLDPVQWLKIKKQILQTDPTTLSAVYTCRDPNVMCPSDYAYLNLDVTVDGNTASIHWPSDSERSLPQRFQDLLGALSVFNFRSLI